jgi:hypothetical protein
MLVVLAATLVFAREKDSYPALYRGGSLNIVAADPREYAWESAHSRVRFRIGADSVVVTGKKATVVIPFEAIRKITCGSGTHSATGRKVAATLILGLGGAIATSGATDTDTFVGLTWGLNNDTALFQFDKKDYIALLFALESKSGKTPIEDNIAVLLALESKSGRLPTDAVHPPSENEKQAACMNLEAAMIGAKLSVENINARLKAHGCRGDDGPSAPAATEPSPDPQVKIMQPTDKPAPEKPCKSWVVDDRNVMTCIER